MPMAKNIPKSKFTELKGLDRIAQTVHEMGCLWRNISKDDVGIDGEIEVLTPRADGKGFQTTGGIIKVQAKSGGSYVSRDSENSFAVSVKKEDLEYWNSCNFPVLFVIYHPKDDKLYCKEVKSYTQSTPDVLRPPRQICFDKALDEFGPSYRSSLLEHAKVDPASIAAIESAASDIRTPKVFICYRRDDSGDAAQSIHEKLVSHFGEDSVFFDVDSIPLGVDFHGILNDAVANCDVLLAVIGNQWMTVVDESGRRRLDDPDDFVRVEIEAAISHSIPVIPVLVGRATIPKPLELPPTLQELARRQAAEVRFGRDRQRHLERLVQGIEQALTVAEEQSATAQQQQKQLSRLNLTKLFKDKDWEFRVSTILALADCTSTPASALIRLLKSEDDEIRAVAADALGGMGPQVKISISALTTLLSDDSWLVRCIAASSLERFGPEAKAAAPALHTLVKDTDKAVREAAVWALGKISPPPDPTLMELLKYNDGEIRAFVADVSEEIGPAAIQVLTELVKYKDPDVQEAAVTALERITPAAIDSI